MAEREPNSKGFWRRNEIIGLDLTLRETFWQSHADPEALALFTQQGDRLQGLKQAESHVRDRARRIRAATASRETLDQTNFTPGRP
jgi:hypothetical protein